MTDQQIREYVTKLADNLLGAGRVDLKVDAEGISLGIDQAISCGLVITELISNKWATIEIGNYQFVFYSWLDLI